MVGLEVRVQASTPGPCLQQCSLPRLEVSPSSLRSKSEHYLLKKALLDCLASHLSPLLPAPLTAFSEFVIFLFISLGLVLRLTYPGSQTGQLFLERMSEEPGDLHLHPNSASIKVGSVIERPGASLSSPVELAFSDTVDGRGQNGGGVSLLLHNGCDKAFLISLCKGLLGLLQGPLGRGAGG